MATDAACLFGNTHSDRTIYVPALPISLAVPKHLKNNRKQYSLNAKYLCSLATTLKASATVINIIISKTLCMPSNGLQLISGLKCFQGFNLPKPNYWLAHRVPFPRRLTNGSKASHTLSIRYTGLYRCLFLLPSDLPTHRHESMHRNWRKSS